MNDSGIFNILSAIKKLTSSNENMSSEKPSNEEFDKQNSKTESETVNQPPQPPITTEHYLFRVMQRHDEISKRIDKANNLKN